MSYVNRFIVEEESQFECDGVFELDAIAPVMRNLEWRKLNLESGDTQSKLHIVISADVPPMNSLQRIEFEDLIYDELYRKTKSTQKRSLQKFDENYENYINIISRKHLF